MKLKYVISAIEDFAPRSIQEPWDNSGLQVGLPEGIDECTGVVLCVDVTERTVAQAVEMGANLIVSHHPLIFKGFKTLTGATAAERATLAAIRAGVAVYSAHTSLDSTVGGVSYAMASAIGARVLRVLAPAPVQYRRMSVICARSVADDVRLALLDAGGGAEPGVASSDSRCIYADVDGETLDGIQPDPTAGLAIGHTALTRVDSIVPSWRVDAVTTAVMSVHGAETARVESSPVDNPYTGIGLGVLAQFDTRMTMSQLVALLKERFGVPAIRATLGYDADAEVSRIALCGGAGGEFIDAAAAAGAQAYVTADVRYHDFCDHRTGMAVFDIGHFESERYAVDILRDALAQKMPSLAIHTTSLINPVKYL